MFVEEAVPEIAEHRDIHRVRGELALELFEDFFGDRAVVEFVHLEHPVAVGDEGIFVRRGPGRIDDRLDVDADGLEVVHHEILERIVAEHGGENHVRTRGPHVFGDHRRTAGEILGPLIFHAERRRLGRAADERAVSVAVHNRVADDVDAHAAELLDGGAEIIEAEALGFQQREEFVHGEIGRRHGDDRRGGHDEIAGGEDDFAAVALDHGDFLLRPGVDAFGGILVTLGEEVGLDEAEVFEGRGVVVHDHVVHALEGGEVHRAQFLRDERAEVGLVDVRVAGEAGDQAVGFALRIHQVADVPGMHEVERAVAHDDAVGARARADGGAELLAGHDLAAVVVWFFRRTHAMENVGRWARILGAARQKARRSGGLSGAMLFILRKGITAGSRAGGW